MTHPDQEARAAFEAFLLRNGDPTKLSEPMREILRLFYEDGWQAALEWSRRQAGFDIDQFLSDTLPGGSSADHQKIADDQRAWLKAHAACAPKEIPV